MCGVLLAMLGDTLLLRSALCLACAAAVVLVVLIWRQGRGHARAVAAAAAETAGRRLDQSRFQSQLDAVYETLGALREQLERMRVEAGELRREMAALHAGKVAAEEGLRRLPAGSEPHVLTPESFSAAAAVLEAFEVSGSDGKEDWVSAWVSGLFDDDGDLVIDLTMHDDTMPIETGALQEVARSA